MSLSYYQIIMSLFYFPQDYMPFSDIYVSTFKNDTEYRQLLIQTAMALQTNKFIQVRVTRNRRWKKAALNSSNLKPVGWTLNTPLDSFQHLTGSDSRMKQSLLWLSCMFGVRTLKDYNGLLWHWLWQLCVFPFFLFFATCAKIKYVEKFKSSVCSPCCSLFLLVLAVLGHLLTSSN